MGRDGERDVMTRTFTPVEAAEATAQYLPADPAVWLDRCALAGIDVSTDGEGLAVIWHVNGVDAEPAQCTFLNCWLNLTPGGSHAVIELLKSRAASRAV
jgi:hypothetical protein